MKALFLTAPLLTLVLAIAGCGDGTSDHGSLRAEDIVIMKEYAQIIEGVTDEASAKAAKPKLQEVLTKRQALKKRAEGLKKSPTPDQLGALKKKYGKEEDEVMTRYTTAMTKMSANAAAYRELEPLMNEIAQASGAGY